MTPAILLTILSLGLGRGFLHALDPDHIMTISALSSREGGTCHAKPLQYAALWSAGHGLMIAAVAGAALFAGLHLPKAAAGSAEFVVGIILILTGASVLWSLRARSAASPEPNLVSARGARFSAAPLLIGFVHGLAGSASLLALIPTGLLEIGPGFAFVTVFCIGVLAAMMAFAIFYDRLQQELSRFAPKQLMLLQGAIGLASIGLGVFWTVKG